MGDLKTLGITAEQNDQAMAVQEELLDLVARSTAAGFPWACIIAGIGAGISQTFVDQFGSDDAGIGLAAHWHRTSMEINLQQLRAAHGVPTPASKAH